MSVLTGASKVPQIHSRTADENTCNKLASTHKLNFRPRQRKHSAQSTVFVAPQPCDRCVALSNDKAVFTEQITPDLYGDDLP